jgi:acyl-CoA dehydrogenase
MTALIVLVCVVLALVLAYRGSGLWTWLVPVVVLLAWWASRGATWPFFVTSAIVVVVAIATGVPRVRQFVIARPAMRLLGPMLPRLSETEQVALEAGTVWWDGELFSGAPRWKHMIELAPQPLADKERRFLAGPCSELCRMLDENAIDAAGDLPPHVWDFIKRERFMGMIIPAAYGGLGFSAIAHSTVVTMLASRSETACVTVMVPNSLGPAELLLHYGTDEQQRYYLPRLAVGDEVPCFALTEPHAGSDAGGMQSRGVVCLGTWEGQDVLGLRLTWNKRYITLAPVATVLGLAFRLFDPDRLLGGPIDLGITCALIPVSTPGVEIGRRHDPMSVAFQNGPTRGTDVFVPIDRIIGGPAMVGQGWRMLMESLSAGRGLSLPANSVGAAQLATRVVGAYATIREQFGVPIGRFEGVERSLARIAGTTYWMNAVRVITAGAVDAGHQPAVVSAIAKCWSTEAMRRVVIDAMDILAGAGICKGPRNTLAAAYQSLPIGITVEGANILTRSMIVFGQGAIRCHPYVLDEISAVATRDVRAFDRALSGHINLAVRNLTRSIVLALSGGAVARTPVGGRAGAVIKQLARLAAGFAVISDAAMATLGGTLKRAEMIAGRMADALAWMYIATATVNRYVADDERDAPLFEWATREAIYQVEQALRGVLDNLPNRPVAFVLRLCVLPFGARRRRPDDRVAAASAKSLLDGAESRSRLTREMFVPGRDDPGLGRLERALELTVAAEPLRAKLREAQRSKLLARGTDSEILDQAVAHDVLTPAERDLVREAIAARDDAIQVDDYAPEASREAREPPRWRTPPVSGRPAYRT